jgi:hypothetical protein
MPDVSHMCSQKYNDHPRDPNFVAVVVRCSEVGLCYKNSNWDSKMVVAEGKWSLAQVVCLRLLMPYLS